MLGLKFWFSCLWAKYFTSEPSPQLPMTCFSTYKFFFKRYKNCKAREMPQQAELLATQVWQPEFHPWNPHEKLGLVLHTCKPSVLTAKGEVDNCPRLQGQLLWSSQRSRNERDCLDKEESQTQLPPKNDLHCTHTTHTPSNHTRAYFLKKQIAILQKQCTNKSGATPRTEWKTFLQVWCNWSCSQAQEHSRKEQSPRACV